MSDFMFNYNDQSPINILWYTSKSVFERKCINPDKLYMINVTSGFKRIYSRFGDHQALFLVLDVGHIQQVVTTDSFDIHKVEL